MALLIKCEYLEFLIIVTLNKFKFMVNMFYHTSFPTGNNGESILNETHKEHGAMALLCSSVFTLLMIKNLIMAWKEVAFE